MKTTITPFISMDKFEEISNEVEKIEMKPIFYSIEDIQSHIEPDIKISLPFAIRLSQQPVKTKKEKEARMYLLQILNETIIFDEEA